MRSDVISHDVDHALAYAMGAAVLVFGGELTVKALHDMPLPAPVIGPVARGVLYHPDAEGSTLKGPRRRGAPLAGTDLASDVLPVHRSEGQSPKLHESGMDNSEVSLWSTTETPTG